MTERRPASDPLEQLLSVAAVGSYVINFGHLEHGVMRMIEWLGGNTSPGQITTSTLQLGWSQLIQRLRADIVGTAVEAEVTRVLEEHQVDTCARLRHSLVHGSVDISQPPTVAINRRARDGSSAIQLGSRQVIEQQCQHVIDAGVALDRLLPEEYRRVKGNLVAGVVGLTRERAIAQGLDPDRSLDEQLADEPSDLTDEP